MTALAKVAAVKEKLHRRTDGWEFYFYGYSAFQVIGLSLSLGCFVMCIIMLGSPNWIAQDLSVSGSFDNGKMNWGM